MPEPSSPPGVDRCLAGLCAALEASRSEPPERVLAGFVDAVMADLAGFVTLRDGVAGVRAVTRDRRPGLDVELRLPARWSSELAEGRLVHGTAAELPERAALRLSAAAIMLAPVPAADGPPTAAILLAANLANGTWSPGQEQALRGLAAGLAGWHSARRWQQLVDHLPQRVAWKDGALRYRGANRAFTRAAGLALPQLLGRVDAELPLRAASSELAEAARQREQQALGAPQLRRPEVVPLPGGREQWFEVSRIPLDGGLLLVRDEISARVGLSQQLQLAQRVAAIGRLAAGVGDELRPIAGEISTAVAAARHDPAALDRIDLHLRALDDLGRQLATFARRQFHEPVELVPGQVLTRMEPTLVRVLGDGVRLALAPPALRCAVRIDPRLFELLLVSLLMHLRARLGGRGRVALEVAPASLDLEQAAGLALPIGEYVRLRVQADPAAAAREAADLRLTLARTIAAMAGGGLQFVTSAAGLRLELYLPRVFTTPRPPEPGPVVDLRGAERLLLVEDDPVLAQTLTAVLRHLGYHVVVADDVAAALPLLQGTCPDDQVPEARISLALLSTALPAPGDSLRRLRAAVPELRVLWLATTPGAAPVADPLVVPCTFEALALRVRQALEARAT